MSNWLIAFFFGAGVAGWAYTMLARTTGNSVPSQTFGGAAIAGVLAFVFLFTLLKYVLGFE